MRVKSRNAGKLKSNASITYINALKLWEQNAMSEREEKFERMMQAVLNSYNSTAEKMDKVVKR